MTTCVFLGNFRAPWCSEVHESASLEELGVQVIRLQEDTTSNQELLSVVNQEKPDLAFFVHTWGWGNMDGDVLNAIKKVCPTVYYHLDLIRGIPERESQVDTSWWYKCDYVFMPDGDKTSVAWFRNKGVNYFYSPPAVFHKGVYLAEPVDELKQDVIFVGAKNYHAQYPYRWQLIERLEQQYGSRFTLWEHKHQMREHRLNQLYASVKVAVGDTFCPGFNRKYYFSDRLWEAAGRGGGCQVFPRIYGIWDYFEEGKEILTYDYNNWTDLFNKIDWLIDHSDEREAMRRAAMERVRKEGTYMHRLQNVLDVVLRGKKNIYESERV